MNQSITESEICINIIKKAARKWRVSCWCADGREDIFIGQTKTKKAGRAMGEWFLEYLMSYADYLIAKHKWEELIMDTRGPGFNGTLIDKTG